MSAVRKTPVPLPGPKSKTKPKIVSSQAALSQEFVDSDDDSSNDNTPQPNPAQAAAKARTTIAVHRPKANGASNSTSKSAAKSKASTTKSSSKVSAPQKKPAPKEVAKKPQYSDSSSSEETGDDSEDDVATPPRSEKKTKDSSESNSESAGDDSDEEVTTQTARPPIADRRQASQSQSHTVEIQQTQPYIPPKGFSAVPMNQNAMSQAAKIFENLQGKQVWHITAPANVSLKDLKEMTMEKALGGEAVLKYKGTEYGFSTTDKSEEGARELMIPHQNGYKAVPSKIFQTLHLQEVVRLPEANPNHAEPSANSEDTASITRSTIRAPRPQVKGLKMRFFLSGFGDREPGTLGESDSEDERQPSGLVIPNGVNLPAKSEKRKRHSANGDAGLESPTKKHKKQLTAEEIKRKGEKRAKKESKRAKELAKGK